MQPGNPAASRGLSLAAKLRCLGSQGSCDLRNGRRDVDAGSGAQVKNATTIVVRATATDVRTAREHLSARIGGQSDETVFDVAIFLHSVVPFVL